MWRVLKLHNADKLSNISVVNREKAIESYTIYVTFVKFEYQTVLLPVMTFTTFSANETVEKVVMRAFFQYSSNSISFIKAAYE